MSSAFVPLPRLRRESEPALGVKTAGVVRAAGNSLIPQAEGSSEARDESVRAAAPDILCVTGRSGIQQTGGRWQETDENVPMRSAHLCYACV